MCYGRRKTYQCTVCGPGATVWTGTLFECDNQNLITLRHREFKLGSSSGACIFNNRALIANSVGISFDANCRECFVSELSFIPEDDFGNKTIRCLHNNGTVENLVDETTVHVVTGKVSMSITLSNNYHSKLMQSHFLPLTTFLLVLLIKRI